MKIFIAWVVCEKDLNDDKENDGYQNSRFKWSNKVQRTVQPPYDQHLQTNAATNESDITSIAICIPVIYFLLTLYTINTRIQKIRKKEKIQSEKN